MNKFYSIVSPMAPNGVTFLLNILLELNVAIYRCIDPKEGLLSWTWNREGREYVIKPKEFQDLTKHLPSLKAEKKYIFESQVFVHWDHPVSMKNYQDFGLMLFTRDPRDSLYSWHRRLFNANPRDVPAKFADYIKMPSARFPELYNELQLKIKNGDELIFKEYWKENLPKIVERNHGNALDEHIGTYEIIIKAMLDSTNANMIVRFEDIKQQSVLVILNILHYLNVKRTHEEIVTALDASRFDVAASQESTASAQAHKVNFKGKIFEHQENPKEKATYDFIREKMDRLYNMLSYN